MDVVLEKRSESKQWSAMDLFNCLAQDCKPKLKVLRQSANSWLVVFLVLSVGACQSTSNQRATPIEPISDTIALAEDEEQTMTKSEEPLKTKDEETITPATPNPSYKLLGKEVKAEEYQAFRKSLAIEQDFIDERLPPQEGGAGGHGAIWQAVDTKGVSYEINEYTLNNDQVYSIRRVK